MPPQFTQRLTLPKATPCPPPTGTGILTRYPSPTLPSLDLGPTNPTRTNLPSETSDLRRIRFSLISRYSCQHSHSRTLQRTSQPAFTAYGTLPYHHSASPLKIILKRQHQAISVFGSMLRPDTLSAQSRLTSELLRTLSRMAASKPTSWLSQHHHLVSHLAYISGP